MFLVVILWYSFFRSSSLLGNTSSFIGHQMFRKSIINWDLLDLSRLREEKQKRSESGKGVGKRIKYVQNLAKNTCGMCVRVYSWYVHTSHSELWIAIFLPTHPPQQNSVFAVVLNEGAKPENANRKSIQLPRCVYYNM